MTYLSDDNQDDVIDAFNTTSRYIDDLLNIDNHYFEAMVTFIGLNRNWIKLILPIPKPPFCLHLSISNGFVSSKIYDKCDDFDFDSNFYLFGW